MAQPINQSPFGFEAKTKKNCHGDFDVKITKPELPVLFPNQKTRAIDFEAKSEETAPVVLRPNH
jgi:hypothetical protein